MAQIKSITRKSEDISTWYNDLIREAKLAEHGPAKGTMIIRPYGFAIWENIQKSLDTLIKNFGSQNAYFPLFIPMSFLQKEKEHVEGFAPELAVVTHGGGEKLTEPLVVRPTSETIMYDAYSRWINSYRDLPVIINQWNNVVRWEKRPYLFLRTTEFLWQEGHTAHATEEEAKQMQSQALDAYTKLYQSYLGLYGYAGKKSEAEKFAGAVDTLTYEMLMPDGKVIQGCTSHNLGQNFSKVFKVKYQDTDKSEKFVWQTSWGFSTRSMGALILGHGDDNGLVLPPQIAPIQVVIIPIVSKAVDSEEIEKLSKKAFEILEGLNIRVKLDDSDNSPGWKFSQADLEGISLRLEIGSTEVKNSEFRAVRRDNKEAHVLNLNNLGFEVEQLLNQIQKSMFEAHKKFTHDNTHQADSYEQFKKIMSTTRGFIEAFWCEDSKCEAKIKEDTKATTRCLPLDAIKAKGECIYCGKEAQYRWIFGQSY